MKLQLLMASVIAFASVGSVCANYDATFVSHNLPSSMDAGETVSVTLTFSNSGSNQWDSNTRVGTSNPRGSTSVFEAPTWLSFDRPTDLNERKVRAGRTGTFTFDVVAPTTPGYYNQSFELVHEGVTWFTGTGDDINWGVQVNSTSTEVTNPAFKCLSPPPPYHPATGVVFTEDMANDMATLDVDMIRMEFIAEADGSIRYPAYDTVVDRAGVREIATLGLIDYASISADPATWDTATFRADFVDRVEEIVTHYYNETYPITDWEIWNEEDMCVSGYCPRIEPAPFALLMGDCYDAIKAIDADATVVLGGISPKGFEYTDNYLDDLYSSTEMQAYYTSNGYYPFDVVAAHPYPEIFSSPTPTLANLLNTEIKAVMNSYGDTDKTVWLTEMGWSTYYHTEANQAAYLTDSYLTLDTLVDPSYPANGPYVERYFWFRYNDWGTADLWGLYNEYLTVQKPSYTAFADLGPSSVNKPTFPSNDDPAYTFDVSKETATAATGLSIQPDASDDLNGIQPTKISGGFHSVVTDPLDKEPAFTDGSGLGALTGLLLDYPGENTPAWSGFWVLDSGYTVDLAEVRVFSGNTGKDGRVFHHYDIYTTTDVTPSASSTWTLLEEEITPASYNTINAGSLEASVSVLSDLSDGELISAITAIRLDFFAVTNLNNTFIDDWDLGQTADRDDKDAAFTSPLIYEVDVYFDAPYSLVLAQESAADDVSLTYQPSSTDALDGIQATTISGGFHSANTNTADQIPAFTDGSGLGSLTGLLADYPGENTPSYSGFWAFGSAVDIDEVRVFSGNVGKDGRVFHHYDAYYTNDATPVAGSTWTVIAEDVTCASYGTTNSGSIEAYLTRLYESGGRPIAESATAIRLDFYAVDNTNAIFIDDWDSGDPNDADGYSAAFVAPLIFEVDVLAD